MDNFISIVIFSIPGLLVYFWIQSFGINPTVKHTPTEQAAIAALFWIPTILISIITYNIIYLLVDTLLKTFDLNWSVLGLTYILDLKKIQASSSNILFICYFFLLSLFYSYIIALVWTKYVYDKLLGHINEIRIKRKISKLDDTTSVWDAFFLKVTTEKEEPLVVEVYKLDKLNEPRIVGSATKLSRPYETDRAIVLENIENNTQSHNYYKYQTKRIYLDIKSGLIVSELDTTKPTENIKDFNSFLEGEAVEQQDD